MAKEALEGKRLKISQAQQNMILAVLGASLFLGSAIALVSNFIRQISFNTKVIMAEEQTIVMYSDTIKNIGICKKPKGSVYSNEELKQCDPDTVKLSDIQGSLRANILGPLAANKDLNSVPKESDTSCKNPDTEKNYTYDELREKYNNAEGTDQLNKASQLIRSCSALRVIPDALPAYKNEEALLASLNKLFKISNWEPESISPAGTTAVSDLAPGLNIIPVTFSVEADSGVTVNVIENIEKSIREFNFQKAKFEWNNNNTLLLKAEANAYYMDESTITETTKTITEDNNTSSNSKKTSMVINDMEDDKS